MQKSRNSTLCYWSYICWFSNLEENYFNVVSIAQFCRYYFRMYSQSPPLKYGGTFLQKMLFMDDKPFRENLWGGRSTWGDKWLHYAKGRGVSQMHFPVIWTLEIWKFSQSMVEKDLSLRLIVNKFQMCHVHFHSCLAYCHIMRCSTHLFMSLFLSVHPLCIISQEELNHVIITFGTHV